MAEINLGSFPYSGGIVMEDESIYIGNNRFIRIASQRSNDAMIGAVYEVTNVFDNAQTVTQVCSEVLYPGDAMNGTKITQLGDGRIAVFGKKYGANTFHMFTISYDSVNNTFVKSDFEDMASNEMNASDPSFMTLVPYGQNTVFIVATQPNYGARLLKCEFANPNTVSTITTLADSLAYDGLYYHASNQALQIIDDKLYLRTSCLQYGFSYVYDITSNTFDNNVVGYYPNVAKLAENKYVISKYNTAGEVTYKLQTTLPTSTDLETGTFTAFTPAAGFVSNIFNDVGRMLESFVLDDQHIMIFSKCGNNNTALDDNIYVKVAKVVDSNYGFISDNTSTGNGVTITANYNGSYNNMAPFYDGSMVKRVDAQRFYIKTSSKSFEFFTLTA